MEGKRSQIIIFLVIIACAALIAFGGWWMQDRFNQTGNKSESSPSPTATLTPTLGPTPTELSSVTGTLSVPTPTTPSRKSDPPSIKISYPSEGQTITFSGQNQQFCVVDVPVSGDISGLKRKHNVNGGGWTSYVSISTLCYEPAEGDNTLQLQYRNNFGEETSVYTRRFTFRRQ